MAMQDFQGLVREGDRIVFEFISGSVETDEHGNWRGSQECFR